MIASSFHTIFDCCALSVTLYALLAARAKADFLFSYGYQRFEVLAAFCTAVFLIFVALFNTIEGFHAISSPSEHNDSAALAVITVAAPAPADAVVVCCAYFLCCGEVRCGVAQFGAEQAKRGTDGCMRLRESGDACDLQFDMSFWLGSIRPSYPIIHPFH